MRSNNTWVRMTLACAAVLAVAGPGLVLANPGVSAYVPKSSQLIGPVSVSKTGGTVPYVLRVLFTDNSTADFPPTTGATFSAVVGSITSGGIYSPPATGTKDKITGSYSSSGVTVTSSKIIALTP